MHSTSFDAAESTRKCFLVTDGLHQGAQFAFTRPHAVVLGSSSEADFILSDPGVAGHHCLFIVADSGIWVRALEAVLEVDDQCLQPGESCFIDVGSVLIVGKIRVVLQEHANEITNLGGERRSVWRWLFRKGWVPLLLSLGLLAGLGFSTVSYRAKSSDAVETLESIEHGAGGSSLAVSSSSDSDAEVNPTGKTAQVTEDTKVGARLAQSVKEILRLSKIEAKTRYLGDGKVEVVGHLGQAETAAAIIQSRAMREIEGLKKILAVNLDSMPAAQHSTPKDKRVISVADGSDPYLVTADGSRYYPGAKLPNGMRLLEIRGRLIQLESTQGAQSVVALGARLDQSALH